MSVFSPPRPQFLIPYSYIMDADVLLGHGKQEIRQFDVKEEREVLHFPAHVEKVEKAGLHAGECRKQGPVRDKGHGPLKKATKMGRHPVATIKGPLLISDGLEVLDGIHQHLHQLVVRPADFILHLLPAARQLGEVTAEKSSNN